MNLVQELDKEIIEAMKAKDSVRLATLRGVKGAIKLQSIDHKKEINDELLIDVVSKEIKSRNESIKEFEKGNRQDLIDKTKEEIDILSKYLPEQLSAEEVEAKVKEIITEIGASSMKDMGMVMKKAKEKLGASADGKTINEVAKKLLS